MDVQFIHLRDKSIPNGGITIAMDMADRESVRAYAIARCNDKDNYNKHVGRAKSGGRLLSQRERFTPSHLITREEVIQRVIQYVMGCGMLGN